ncbi:unnamed protein product [Mesocestoides corti]|uniref:Transmembrane protein 164 n=1 Tax=Mesocestoides corti TaxID=53468 RepID=A0A158QVM7_MESCO|nr:unnamed protein product [Mesocestoides corti]
MFDFGLFYDGILWNVQGEGGAECLSFLSLTQRFIETVFFTVIYGFLVLWCVPRLKLPLSNRNAPPKHNHWLAMTHCLVFGAEIGYKLSSRSLIFIFNPCHVLTAVQVSFKPICSHQPQIWLLFAQPSSFVTAVFRLHLHCINGTLLALIFPITSTRKASYFGINNLFIVCVTDLTLVWFAPDFPPALQVIYFVQHVLILVIPAYILDQNSVYSTEPLGDFNWVLTSLAIQTLYHFLFLQPLSLLTHANLNQMLCPSPSDPFAGPYYRIAAMIHQPLLIIVLGKLYSIVVLSFHKSVEPFSVLRPLCSSFHWLLGLSVTTSVPTKSDCDKICERKFCSMEEF